MRTPLHDLHVASARRMMDFHGWEMPLYYEGIVKEHRRVRTRVGFFDVSHMGKLLLDGPSAAEELQALIPSNLPRGGGVCRYTHLLDRDGTILDDVIFICVGPNRYLCVCNAGPRERVIRWFRDRLAATPCRDRTTELVCLALQGPEAEATLQPFVNVPLGKVRPFRGAVTDTSLGVPSETEGWAPLSRLLGLEADLTPASLYVTRTGYTGEDGFELYAPNALGRAVWTRLVEGEGVQPVGLGARDTLRLEKGYLLSGQDFDGAQTPLHVGYGWLIDWDHDFVGQDALVELKDKGAFPTLRGIRLTDRGVPRPGQTLWQKGAEVGYLTSGTLSPTLKIGIGLGYLPREAAEPGTEVQVSIRTRRVDASVVETPFL